MTADRESPESEAALLRAAVDALGLLIAVVDAGGRVKTANQAFDRAAAEAGVSSRPLFWELAGPESERTLVRAAFQGFDAERFPGGFLVHLPGAGHARIVDWSARVITQGAGPLVLLSGVDLSERLRVGARLGQPDVIRRLLLDAIPAVIWTTDRELHFTSSAGGGLENLALAPGQVVGTSLYGYFHTSDPDHPVIAAHRAALAGERSSLAITVLDRTFQAVIDPLAEERGGIIGCIGIALDITGRVEVERALRESEARLRRLVESNVIGILFWRSDGRITEANQAFADLVGYRREELLAGAASWISLTAPEYAPVDARALAEIRATGGSTPYEKELVSKTGDRVPVLVGGAALDKLPLADPYEGVGFVLDLREQVRLRSARDDLLIREQGARRDVEHANARLRLLVMVSERLARCRRADEILTALAELVVPTFADWSYVVHTARAEGRRLVATAHADPGRAELLRSLHSCSPDPEAPEGAPRVFRTGELALYEDIGLDRLNPRPPQWPIVGTRDPEHLHIIRELGMRSLLCVPIPGRAGVDAVMMLVSAHDPHRYGRDDLLLARDLAQRAAASLENARLLEEALDAVRVRDEFLSIAAHELRTPMTSLMLRIENLRRAMGRGDAGRERAERAVDAGERQARRLSSLIDDLLDVSRLAANRMVVHADEVDLVRIVHDVVAALSAELRRVGCAVEILAPAQVVGNWDRARMEQVLTNLLSNAMKFGAGRPVEVAVTDSPTEVTVSVRDQGIGISREDQERIFGRFERAVSTRHFGGLGLGLYISVQIVRAHGGSLRVDSEPGRGARFTVVLPR